MVAKFPHHYVESLKTRTPMTAAPTGANSTPSSTASAGQANPNPLQHRPGWGLRRGIGGGGRGPPGRIASPSKSGRGAAPLYSTQTHNASFDLQRSYTNIWRMTERYVDRPSNVSSPMSYLDEKER